MRQLTHASSRRALAVAALLTLASLAAPLPANAEPVKFRVSWVLVPSELTPIMAVPPGVTRHEGKSYILEHTHFGGGPLAVTAFAGDQVDIAGFGYATIATAIQGAGISDLRVIGDVLQDGVDGVSANVYMVRKDSPVQKVEDLKGRVVAVNVKGSLLDIGLRAMLQKHGLDEDKDLSVVEVSFPNMKATLLDRKVEMIGTVLPFLMDPQLQANARTLFTALDAAGREQMSTLVTRAEFIARNRAPLVDFMEDYIRAVRWFTDPANHQQAVAIVADFTKQPASALDSWLFTRTDQYHNPNALPDAELLQQNVDLLQRLGYVKNTIDMRHYVDASLARDAMARVGAAPGPTP